MTVIRVKPPIETPYEYHGDSDDVKPGRESTTTDNTVEQIPIGSLFIERDTGDKYEWDGYWPWRYIGRTMEAMAADLVAATAELVKVAKATHRGHEEYTWENEVEIEE